MPLADRLYDDIEGRHEQDREAGGGQHPGEDGDADRSAGIGAGTLGEDERRDTEDEGEGCHQDGAEPRLCGFAPCLDNVFAFIVQVTGEFDDQDGVLGR